MKRAERKKQLIAQCALYRAEVMVSAEIIHEGLQPLPLMRSGLQQIRAMSDDDAHGILKLAAVLLQAVVPVASNFLSKKKPLAGWLLRTVLITGATAGTVVFILQKIRMATKSGDMQAN